MATRWIVCENYGQGCDNNTVYGSSSISGDADEIIRKGPCSGCNG